MGYRTLAKTERALQGGDTEAKFQVLKPAQQEPDGWMEGWVKGRTPCVEGKKCKGPEVGTGVAC